MKKKFLALLTAVALIGGGLFLGGDKLIEASGEKFALEDRGQHDAHDHGNGKALGQTKEKNNFVANTDRTTAKVCIESFVDGVNASDVSKKVINQVEKTLKKHNNWQYTEIDKYKFEVVTDCSFSPLLLEEDKKHVFYASDLDSMRVVDTVSPERLGIFIVDQAVVDKHFKGLPTRWNPEEFYCEEGSCGEATTGIYLTQADIESPKFVQELKHGFGLELSTPADTAEDEALLKEKESEK